MSNKITVSGILLFVLGIMFSPVYAADADDYGYSFGEPDKVFMLSDELDEISGLTLFDNTHLAAIHDEQEKLFIIDFNTGEISATYDLGGIRDYEGIERIGDSIFVLVSNGKVYEVENWPKNTEITRKYKTGLGTANDNEGLAYDSANHRLLIACKEFPGNDLKGFKTVYAYDLERKTLLPEPVYKIDTAAVEQLLQAKYPKKKKKKKGWFKRKKQIKPAALAVHPVTQQLFIISSVKRVLIILNKDGTLADAYKLPKIFFGQPEGMAFLPNGDLLISNEKGGREAANLLRFNYKKTGAKLSP